jgi:hypothetical protein
MDAKDWISVKDRLPEKHLEVLTYGSYGYVVGHINGITGAFYAVNTDYETGEPYLPDHVTHWRPLPDPPKKETSHA